MEKQIADILELLKNGMKEIPEIGSKGWNAYVQAYKVDHLIQFIFCTVIALLIIAAFVTLLVLNAKTFGDYDFPLTVVGSVGGIVMVFLVLIMYFGLRGYLVPEYSIVQSIVSGLSD